MTTAQRLGTLIKSCRDIMRKDKGLNGDLDRLPMLTWILFLKFLDDMERIREDEAILEGKPFRSAIDKPYRWRDWNRASLLSGADGGLHNAMTGDALIAFVSQDQALRPDGERGAGLFAHLRTLQGAVGQRDRRDVVATVFRNTVNRMQSGYLLRDVLDKVNEIHFTSSDEIHTLGHLYEAMLKEMRDAAGDSGEFYTPRALVKMIVRAIDPQPGETILDPAAGTGGFLVEAYEHLKPLCITIEQLEWLQCDALHGIEAKSLPYLLCQMNLLLHGVEAPDIDPGNALRFRTSEIGDRDRVDIIVTNPPFGGEEEPGIQNNFPLDKQTSETALLFLQFIMRKLRRPGDGSRAGGRAGVVVPNGTLFSSGAAIRIRQELVENFNLHTVVRLPVGVFAPYTGIATNVLFFDRSGPTTEIWYYEHPLPAGRTSYTKTRPLQIEELVPLAAWWTNRKETDQAWRVSAEEIAKQGYNLDLQNPRRVIDLEHRTPTALVDAVVEGTHALDLGSIRVREVLKDLDSVVEQFPVVELGDLMRHRKEFITIDDSVLYKRCRVQLHMGGIVLRDVVTGSEIRTKKQQICHAKNLLVAEIDAKVGGFGVVPEELEGAIVSSHYFLYEIDESVLRPSFLGLYARTRHFFDQVKAQGSTNYAAIRPAQVLHYKIPLPPVNVQAEVLRGVEQLTSLGDCAREVQHAAEALVPASLHQLFETMA